MTPYHRLENERKTVRERGPRFLDLYLLVTKLVPVFVLVLSCTTSLLCIFSAGIIPYLSTTTCLQHHCLCDYITYYTMPGNFNSIPPSVIASWPKPNYIDPVRRSWLPAFSCTLLGVSTILITGRFYLRARREAGDFGLDDLFIAIGYVVSIGFTAEAVINSMHNGLDVHTWDVPIEEWVPAALTGWISQVLFLISVSATKTSVLLFYRRMAKDTYSRRWLYAIFAALAANAAFFVAALIVFCLMCQPVRISWV